MKDRCKFLAGVFAFIFFALRARAIPTTNGIYAGFNTSMGTFYCNLDYVHTPRTVANFIGLATGTKAWLNQTNGAISKYPFYNSLTFHRIYSNWFIQGGSQLGDGSDEPGYTFNNEINGSTGNFNNGGVLAMANAGGTNSNGAQFFVTTIPYTGWNGLYTVFGNVAEGFNVVSNISLVPLGANNKPLVPVVISNVTILRIGAAASNFNASAVTPALPGPAFKASRLYAQSSPNFLLTWSYLSGFQYRVCYTTDLRNWTVYPYVFQTPPYNNQFPFSDTANHQFFEIIESEIDP